MTKNGWIMAQHTVWIALNDRNFATEALDCSGLIMVAFWSDWRGSCHIMTPVIEHVAASFTGRLRVGRWDLDRHPELPRRYGVHTAPTLVFFQQGQVIEHIQGVISTRELSARTQALLDAIGA